LRRHPRVHRRVCDMKVEVKRPGGPPNNPQSDR
jgi:hypothetical protein